MQLGYRIFCTHYKSIFIVFSCSQKLSATALILQLSPTPVAAFHQSSWITNPHICSTTETIVRRMITMCFHLLCGKFDYVCKWVLCASGWYEECFKIDFNSFCFNLYICFAFLATPQGLKLRAKWACIYYLLYILLFWLLFTAY